VSRNALRALLDFMHSTLSFKGNLECTTDSIRVAPAGQEVNCMTYSPR